MQVHPQQISPGEQFSIFYFLRNHTDGATYYVRAVVYDVSDGTVLATLDLTQSPTNSRLFIKTAEAPSDPTGYGRNIVAIASVYTDSSYTTKSENYEEQEQYFLVRNQPMFGLGGGTIDIDYERIREILAKEADKAAKAHKPSAPQQIPLESLFGTLGKLQQSINAIPTQGFDPSNLNKQLTAIMQSIRDLPPPTEFQETDLSSLEEAIFQVAAQLRTLEDTIRDGNRASVAAIRDEMVQITPQIITVMNEAIQSYMAGQQVTIPLDKLFAQTTKPKEASYDEIKHLLHS